MAVTPTGEVWTWGAGASGQLGDSGISNRSTPQAVVSGANAIGSWAPAAPTLSAPSQTFNAAQTIVLGSSTSGATIRYNLTGDEPTESDNAVPANGEVLIEYSSLLRAKVFVDGQFAGSIARADYELQSAAPAIDPPTGTYATAQTVTLSVSGAPATIHYTLDGNDPTEASTSYSAPFTVNTLTTIKARAFPTNGWAASSATSATLSFNYGTLDPPSASPSAGVFATAPQVTLTSIAGASIRYTLNGTTPTTSSTLYTTPITMPAAGATLKSIAFHADWTASSIQSDVYTVDTTAPTIEAQYEPAPLNSWSRTPVTVSFYCSDNVQVASCSPSSSFTLEGAGQSAIGTALDAVGNESQLPVTMNLDFTPPSVTVSSPLSGLVTTNSALSLAGEVGDALSGLDTVTCNGVAATIVDGDLSCNVTLRPGRNVVVVAARDLAGNSASSGLVVTLAGAVTEISLSPSQRTMLIGESTTLSLRDAFGLAVQTLDWSTSDPAIVSMSIDDPPVLTALAEGQVTITAYKGSIGTAASITVIAGTVLADGSTVMPAGTTRWKLPTPMSSQSMRTAPIYTHRVDANGPDFFTVEPNFTTHEYTVRAVSGDGGVLWKEAAPGLPVMGDAYGALIAGVEEGAFRCALYWGEDRGCFTALVRFGGSETVVPWRYDSAGYLDRPAQGPDGTIYVIEHLGGFGRAVDNDVFSDYGNNKSVVILDGATGQVLKRVPLQTEYSRTPCGFSEYEPRTHGPIVNSNGDAYLLVHKDIHVATGTCNAQITVLDEAGWSILRLTRNGQVDSVVVDPSDELIPRQFMPDGVDGLLLRATTSSEKLIRFDANWQRTEHVIALATRIDLIGQGGIVYLQSRTGNDNFYGITEAFNVTTMTSLWTKSPGWNLTAAKPNGGGTAVDSANQLLDIDSTGELGRTTSFGVARPIQLLDTVIGQGIATSELTAVAFDASNATRWYATLMPVASGTFEPSIFGSPQSNLSVREIEVSITVNSFIPEQWVDHPNIFAGTIFEGDNRSWSRNGHSRIHQEVFLSLNPNSFRNLPRIGTTREFHKASSLDAGQNITPAARNDTILNDGYLKVGEATASMSGVTATRQQSGNVVTVHLIGSVGNPLTTSPNIDYDISFAVDFSDPANLQFTLIGDHDGFPNYEVYVNTEHIHGYAHGSETPFSLIDPLEKHFEKTGRVRQ